MRIYYEVNPFRYRSYANKFLYIFGKEIMIFPFWKSYRKLIVKFNNSAYYLWFDLYFKISKIKDLKALNYEIKHKHLKLLI